MTWNNCIYSTRTVYNTKCTLDAMWLISSMMKYWNDLIDYSFSFFLHGNLTSVTCSQACVLSFRPLVLPLWQDTLLCILSVLPKCFYIRVVTAPTQFPLAPKVLLYWILAEPFCEDKFKPFLKQKSCYFNSRMDRYLEALICTFGFWRSGWSYQVCCQHSLSQVLR